MENSLTSQLERYKKDNTASSKDAMLATINSISSSTTNNNTIEVAKRALTSTPSNKDDIVQSIESVISSLS